MTFGHSSLRRIGFIEGWERFDTNETMHSDMPQGRQFLDQICVILLVPSLFCTFNVMCFFSEIMYSIRLYICMAWIVNFLYKLIAIAALLLSLKRMAPRNMVIQYNIVNYVVFGTIALASLIYFALFINLYKLSKPREDKWARPEVALLYEGIPLLIANIFIIIFLPVDIESPNFYRHYMNYEMRGFVICAAVLQFTYVFNFTTIIKILQYFKSAEFRVLVMGASVSPVLLDSGNRV